MRTRADHNHTYLTEGGSKRGRGGKGEERTKKGEEKQEEERREEGREGEKLRDSDLYKVMGLKDRNLQGL